MGDGAGGGGDEGERDFLLLNWYTLYTHQICSNGIQLCMKTEPNRINTTVAFSSSPVLACVDLFVYGEKLKYTTFSLDNNFPLLLIFMSFCPTNLFVFVLNSSHRHQDNGIASTTETFTIANFHKMKANMLRGSCPSFARRKNREWDTIRSHSVASQLHIYRQRRNNVLLSRLFPSETFPKMLSEWHVVDKQTKELVFCTVHTFSSTSTRNNSHGQIGILWVFDLINHLTCDV